jgi:asparagine synthase (glutamine-hydrolysing)
MRNYGFAIYFDRSHPKGAAPVSIQIDIGEGTAIGPSFRMFALPFARSHERGQEHQPILTSRVVLVYHGHIDNRRDVLQRLGRLDLTCAPDGEVLAEAYSAWGKEFPAEVLGEYSFALIDRQTGTLLAGRDSLGIRNLFYREEGKKVWVASDCSSLFSLLPARPPVDQEIFAEYLAGGGFLLSDRTFYQGLRQVPPGHTLHADSVRVVESHYWQPDPEHDAVFRDEQEYETRLKELLFDAVGSALRSTGPVACDLSGGLDSSSVSAIASVLQSRGQGSSHGLSLVSVIYSSTRESDESDFQKIFLGKYPQKHYEVDHDTCQAFDRLEGDNSIEPSLRILRRPFEEAFSSHFSDQGIYTRLTGLGGDQVFVSNGFPPLFLSDFFLRFKWKSWSRHLMAWLRKGDRSLWNLLWHCSRGTLQTSFAGRLEPGLPNWLTPRFRNEVSQVSREFWCGGKRSFTSPATEMLYRAIRVEINRLRFLKFGVEDVRHPLLARPVVEFMLAVPWEQKIVPKLDRILLRQALKGILPEPIWSRRSQGDLMPFTLRGLRENWVKIKALIADPCLADFGLVEPKSFQAACERLRHGLHAEKDISYFMALLSLEIWLQQEPSFSSSPERYANSVSNKRPFTAAKQEM